MLKKRDKYDVTASGLSRRDFLLVFQHAERETSADFLFQDFFHHDHHPFQNNWGGGVNPQLRSCMLALVGLGAGSCQTPPFCTHTFGTPS